VLSEACDIRKLFRAWNVSRYRGTSTRPPRFGANLPPGLQLRLTGMRNTVVMSEDGSVATIVRKVSRVASGRYAVYLPTGLNDLWEDWNRHNVKLLVILKPIKG